MKISVHLTPGSKVNRIVKTDKTHYRVWVKEVPVNGRANRALIKTISDHLNLKPCHISLISGFTSREKILEII
jgi:uncharacterized protein YggU (UPF0235/DUF167 family)